MRQSFVSIYQKNISSEFFINKIIAYIEKQATTWKIAHVKFRNPFDNSPNILLISKNKLMAEWGFIFFRNSLSYIEVHFLPNKNNRNITPIMIAILLWDFISFLHSHFVEYLKNTMFFTSKNNFSSVPPTFSTPQLSIISLTTGQELSEKIRESLLTNKSKSGNKDFPWSYYITNSNNYPKVDGVAPYLPFNGIIVENSSFDRLTYTWFFPECKPSINKWKYLSFILINFADYIHKNFQDYISSSYLSSI